MNEQRLIKIIKRANEKMEKKLSIKNEVFVLSCIYEFIQDIDNNERILPLLENNFDNFKSYQETYEINRKNKIRKKLRLRKENEYVKIWGTKSFFYKLIHRNLSPTNNDLRSMVLDDIDSLISKLNVPKKR